MSGQEISREWAPLDAQRWRRVAGLVEVALELDRSTRGAYLENLHRQDKPLHDHVVGVMRHLGQFGSNDHEARRDTSKSFIEGHLGPWRLIRLIGRGGMGAVFLAERDDEEYERQVAIKVIGNETGMPIVFQRFLSERQILAAFDHPYIARLFDGGTAGDGRPYLVMEYVDGIPVDRFCFENNLPLVERLVLFSKICSAVAYAHRNLVVHRDIKPTNILVTPDGEPKLLDFGIAKLLDPATFPVEIEKTHTVDSPMTPNWASPEQLRGGPITTLTDIYALGLLLYKLVTGSLPHADRQNICGSLESLEVSPAKPSRRVLAEHAADGDPQAWNHSDLRRVSRALQGDLDNIILKALRAEPNRNYGSVGDLAQDLRRLSVGEPVSATRDTPGYLLRKFLGRHRIPIAVVASGIGLFLAFSIVSVRQGNEVKRQAAIAEHQKNQAVSEKERAQETRRFLQALFEDVAVLERAGDKISLGQILELGFRRVDEDSVDDTYVAIDILKILASAFSKMGRFSSATECYSLALSLAVASDSSLATDLLTSRARSLVVSGDWNSAERDFEEVLKSLPLSKKDLRLEILGELVSLTVDGGYPAEGLKILRRLLEELDLQAVPAGEHYRSLQDWSYGLANAGYAGEAEEALLILAKATWNGDEPFTGAAVGDLIQLYSFTNQATKTQKICSARELAQGSVPRVSADYQVDLMCGRSYASVEDFGKAMEYFANARKIHSDLASSSGDIRNSYFLALGYFYEAELWSKVGSADNAKKCLDNAISSLMTLRTQSQVIYIHNAYTMALLLADRLEEARPLVADLVERGWRRADFILLAKEKNALPATLPPLQVDTSLPPQIRVLRDQFEKVQLPWNE